MRSFYANRIEHITWYIEGFGGIFLSRAKDGMIVRYTEKNKRVGTDDHFTVLLDKQKVKGIHRKVSDDKTDVYMKYDSDYIFSSEGMRKFMQDMQKQSDMPLAMKLLLMILYRAANWASQGKHHRNIELLGNSEALKLGVKPPCIYVKLRYVDRFVFSLYSLMIAFQTSVYRYKFKERPSEGFREQKFVGSHITKKKKES